MAVARRTLSISAVMLLAGCSIAGPILDSKLDDAPFQACTRLAAAGEAAGAAPQCLSLYRRGPNREFLPFDGNSLAAGDTLYATRSAAPECAGDFTHAVAAGDTSGPGRLTLAVADAVGRGDAGRTFSWREARTNRRWSVGQIDTPAHIPGTVRIHVEEGEIRLSSLCLKSYRREYERLT